MATLVSYPGSYKALEQFIEYMDYVKGLEFEEQPNYRWIQTTFRDLFARSGFQQDFMYDWTILQVSEDAKEG